MGRSECEVISIAEARVKRAIAESKNVVSIKQPTVIKRKEIDMFRKLLEDVKEGKVWVDK